jgi:hypothetical protein
LVTRLLTAALVSVALIATSSACKTTSSIAFVNPTDQTLFVHIDEHPPFEVPARGAVNRPVPAVERLQPMTVTALDARGATVFAVTTSLPHLEASGHRLELKATGPIVDPLLQQYTGIP